MPPRISMQANTMAQTSSDGYPMPGAVQVFQIDVVVAEK